ncbi:MAG: 4Fe-4S dicluster domain-containing protein [Deltaproteobacteria bacterium]|nr:4Fe-4S dicluster domain-containing protein [Deltaproteobacteria bacterium]
MDTDEHRLGEGGGATTRFLGRGDLEKLVAELLGAGTRVVAPVDAGKGETEYRVVGQFTDAKLGAALPRRSLKEFFLPPTEELFRWRRDGAGLELQEAPASFPATVILGAFPCDAAAVQTLDKVMGWDYRDDPWFGRREATTIVALACNGQDGSCFCTAVGLGPDAARGSDLLLTAVRDGYEVQVLTAKGAALVGRHAARFAEACDEDPARNVRREACTRVSSNLQATPEKIRGWLQANFEHPIWKGIALRCHGCGACAAVCPTCHCFDIVDEPEGLAEGARRRNWDTCQTPVFTLHASGHNPRADQNARIRQRLNHKFRIYQERFGELLCTGCGRCARACPGGMDLPELLGALEKLAVSAPVPVPASAPVPAPAGGAFIPPPGGAR